MKDHKQHDLNTAIEAKVEASIAETLKSMSDHTKISIDQMVNTALKRFIATHSDYLPPRHKKGA